MAAPPFGEIRRTDATRRNAAMTRSHPAGVRARAGGAWATILSNRGLDGCAAAAPGAAADISMRCSPRPPGRAFRGHVPDEPSWEAASDGVESPHACSAIAMRPFARAGRSSKHAWSGLAARHSARRARAPALHPARRCQPRWGARSALFGGGRPGGREGLSRALRRRSPPVPVDRLGPRTDLEIERRLRLEVHAERLTSIDPACCATPARRGRLHAAGRTIADHSLRIGRLRKLAALEPTLRRLGEQGDIVRTMQRALKAAGVERASAEQVIHPPESMPSITGRIVARTGRRATRPSLSDRRRRGWPLALCRHRQGREPRAVGR